MGDSTKPDRPSGNNHFAALNLPVILILEIVMAFRNTSLAQINGFSFVLPV